MTELEFEKIYWLSGSSCAGKTTISEALASRFGWQIYHCDEWFEAHRKRSFFEKQPTFHQVSKLRGDDLWLRPIEEQIRTEILFHGEELALVLDDLQVIMSQDSRPLLFEGSSALPHLLQPLLPSLRHAFWLVPTESFQRYYYAQRPWVEGQLATTSNPELAFENWMQRDAGFARWLEKQVHLYKMKWLKVDGLLSIEETVTQIAHHFQST